MAKPGHVEIFSKKGLVGLIGIDYSLLQRSKESVNLFFLSSIFVIGILLISFLSVFYAFDLLFHKWYLELLFAAFFSLTFFTIYILLLQTFSKEVLPGSGKSIFNLSNICRAGFILFLGFLISQPIRIFATKQKVEKDLIVYKKLLYTDFRLKSYALYKDDLYKLNNQKIWLQKLAAGDLTTVQIEEVNRRISDVNLKISNDNTNTLKKITNSDFFLKRIELANKYPVSWIICLAIIIIFFIPAYLIYSISEESIYYRLKRQADLKLIMDDYHNFKYAYSLIFKEKYKIDNICFYERFVDPPFNTRKKSKSVSLKQEYFFNDLY